MTAPSCQSHPGSRLWITAPDLQMACLPRGQLHLPPLCVSVTQSPHLGVTPGCPHLLSNPPSKCPSKTASRSVTSFVLNAIVLGEPGRMVATAHPPLVHRDRVGDGRTVPFLIQLVWTKLGTAGLRPKGCNWGRSVFFHFGSTSLRMHACESCPVRGSSSMEGEALLIGGWSWAGEVTGGAPSCLLPTSLQPHEAGSHRKSPCRRQWPPRSLTGWAGCRSSEREADCTRKAAGGLMGHQGCQSPRAVRWWPSLPTHSEYTSSGRPPSAKHWGHKASRYRIAGDGPGSWCRPGAQA